MPREALTKVLCHENHLLIGKFQSCNVYFSRHWFEVNAFRWIKNTISSKSSHIEKPHLKCIWCLWENPQVYECALLTTKKKVVMLYHKYLLTIFHGYYAQKLRGLVDKSQSLLCATVNSSSLLNNIMILQDSFVLDLYPFQKQRKLQNLNQSRMGWIQHLVIGVVIYENVEVLF